ncbi:MAG: VRR-NUC domain-containing protein [Ruminococcus sp.]|nr:VRR-NUC domain-containing protein [Ruminococcus sp.]
MTEEHRIQNEIRLTLADECVLFRTNAGDFWQGEVVYSKEFKQRVLINIRRIEGLPNGYSDLSGVRKKDGKAVFIEVKTPKGRPSAEQKKFLEIMQKYGAISGICRSKEDAINLINGGK